MREEVVIEAPDIEEDRLVIKEEFSEKGKVLGKELMLVAVDLVYGMVRVLVDHFPGRIAVLVLAEFL